MTHQVALQYSRKYGADKVRVLTLVKNRGKGGAVRMVRPKMPNCRVCVQGTKATVCKLFIVGFFLCHT